MHVPPYLLPVGTRFQKRMTLGFLGGFGLLWLISMVWFMSQPRYPTLTLEPGKYRIISVRPWDGLMTEVKMEALGSDSAGVHPIRAIVPNFVAEILRPNELYDLVRHGTEPNFIFEFRPVKAAPPRPVTVTGLRF